MAKPLDLDRLLGALDDLVELETLVNIEAFPGMRLKDTVAIRERIAHVARIFAEEIANAQAGGLITTKHIKRLQKEAEDAIKQDVERMILESIIPTQEE